MRALQFQAHLIGWSAFAVLALASVMHGKARSPIMESEFIYQPGPYPLCHASTLAETSEGELVAAWFGGTAGSDRGVSIYVSRRENGRWTKSRKVAYGEVGGETWSEPVETRFSDTSAKFHFGRLLDGRFYYVGNPVGRGRLPLALSLSRDGVRFDRHYILGEQRYATRSDRGSGTPPTRGSYGYPHTLVPEGYLHVIVSRQKEAIQVLRVNLAELGP